jgi:hypothetical protein
MKVALSISSIVYSLAAVCFIGCGKPTEPAPPAKGSGNNGGGLLNVGEKENATGEYIILDTLTDQFNRAKAKAKAEAKAAAAQENGD